MTEWSLLKKLIWLRSVVAGGASYVWKLITGSTPLMINYAVAKHIRSLTQQGKCVQNGTPTPDAPVDIKCNNGTIKASVNLCDVNEDTALVGYYIATNGEVRPDQNNWIYQEFIPVKPSTKYTLSVDTPLYYVTISEYSDADVSAFVRRNSGTTGGNTSLTITTASSTRYVRFGANISSAAVTLADVLVIKWMLNAGTSGAPYTPYVEGGLYVDGTPEVLTVSADGAEPQTLTDVPMLLALGSVTDRAELITGIKTGRIGYHIFDGTESFTKGTTGFYTSVVDDQIDAPYIPLCTHFAGADSLPEAGSNMVYVYWTSGGNPRTLFSASFDTYATATAFKAYLSGQNASGTPVIVFYQLAEKTTEHIATHHLRTADGTNSVTVTSEVGPVTLSVGYAAAAS